MIPAGTKLAEGWTLPPGYEVWTVQDVIDMLEEYPRDARLWITEFQGSDEGDMTIRPIELIYGSNGDVFL